MELSLKSSALVITSEKREVVFDTVSIIVDGMVMDFPWEYERSGIGVEIRCLGDILFAAVHIERHTIAYVSSDTAEIPETVVEFLGNVDMLFLPSGPHAQKTYEILEPRIVVPFGEDTPLTLATLGQSHVETVTRYKTKESDFEADETRFIVIA